MEMIEGGATVRAVDTEIKSKSGHDKVSIPTAAKTKFLAKNIVEKGWSYSKCYDYAHDNWGVSKRNFTRYYQGALQYLCPEDGAEIREKMIAANMTRLETILEEAMENHDRKSAIDCIKTMNTMLGIGTPKAGVRVENKDEEGKVMQAFEIVFGE